MITNYIWMFLFVGLSILLFLIVPIYYIKKSLLFGLIGGFFLAVFEQILGVSLKWWSYNVSLVNVFNFPLGVALMWVPAVILFGYIFHKYQNIFTRIIIIFIFAAITTVFTYGSVLLNFREYLNWNLYYDFGLALVTHLVLGIYLYWKEKQ